uniref:Retrotransposon protein, putative, Ty3-gypsy subclass n=1 Tax=Tanacetum cinerariifolium TaxID=118510 RepID=A0A6L2MZ34_TANCI|nr:retrotransposon protein, putative, Ty3-gypsy subclass [Tanacetum cinerariifolium]
MDTTTGMDRIRSNACLTSRSRPMVRWAYSALETIADDPQNITSQVRQLIIMYDPYIGSTDEQDRVYKDLDRITCEETNNLWSFLEDFRQLAIKSGKLYFPSTTEKLFAKLPPSLSKKIEESFKSRHPGLSAGVLPAIKFTHTFVSEMCKDAALAKELRDLSLCSAIPIPGYYKNNRKKYGIRKLKINKRKPHNSHVKPFKKKYKDDIGRVKKRKCFICRKEGHFAKDCRSKQGNIARSVIYQELDLDDNWILSQQILMIAVSIAYQKEKEKEQLWKTERSLLVRDLTDALKIIDQLKAEQMRLEEKKDKEIKKLKAQLQEKRDKEIEATHRIKQGSFLIEGNKFKIPLIYAFDMRDRNGSKALLEQFKPVIDRLKHQVYIGEEPLKHWKKNGKLCKLDIINPDITIEDRPLKHVTPAMEDSFKKHVDSLLKIDAIRPSKSRHRTMAMIINSGTTIDPVTGKEIKGKERMFFNYKSLNDNTYKDQYSLPGINMIIKRVGGVKVFSKFDLKSRFHQVAMDEESIPWNAFLVPGGLYEWLVMPFGLKNAPALVRKIKEQVQNLPDLEIPPENAYIILETDGCMEGWGGIGKWKKSKEDPKECTKEMKELAVAALYSMEEALLSPNAF